MCNEFKVRKDSVKEGIDNCMILSEIEAERTRIVSRPLYHKRVIYTKITYSLKVVN